MGVRAANKRAAEPNAAFVSKPSGKAHTGPAWEPPPPAEKSAPPGLFAQKAAVFWRLIEFAHWP